MPGFDRTGPEGEGSRTGRQMGKCARPATDTKNNDSQEEQAPEGRGLGLKRGAPRGQGRGLGAGKRPGRGAGRGRNI